ncbi:VOC family protein [Micromonospora sp. NPDC005299]|uniref:VOC family protein n=1 Tax=Micromonospora sp. NPDC005299 TaxID=3364231 RepID=UPI00369E0A8F
MPRADGRLGYRPLVVGGEVAPAPRGLPVPEGSVSIWDRGVPLGDDRTRGAVHPRKRGKNRLHLDLVSDGDPVAEIDRLIGLGARRVDVGQTGTEGFVVLADPEDNEFCVLDRRPS